MIRHRMIAGLIGATAIVGLSACGSDSKSLITTPAKDTTAETAAPADTATDAPVTTTNKTTTTTDGESASGTETIPEVTHGSAPLVTTGEATGDCVQMQKDIQDAVGVTDLDNLDADKMEQAFDEIKKRVPDDLKDDVDTMTDAFLPFLKAMQNVGTDPKALQDPDVVAAMGKLQDPKVAEATNNLNTWFNAGCPS